MKNQFIFLQLEVKWRIFVKRIFKHEEATGTQKAFETGRCVSSC